MPQLTRDELHDLVWSVPGTLLAKRFGISDVGFAKTCARHEIPRPTRGYWARKKAGRRVQRVPLPALSPGERDLRTITIYGTTGNKQVRLEADDGSGNGICSRQRTVSVNSGLPLPIFKEIIPR